MSAPEDEDDDLDIEFVPEEPLVLMEDACWVSDPQALHHDEGGVVLAVLYRSGALWYLDAETRQWFNADKDGAKKARPVRPVN